MPEATASDRIDMAVAVVMAGWDHRATTQRPREHELLIQELAGFERLLKQTEPAAPERDKLLRRMAEGYVELRAAASREAMQAGLSRERQDKLWRIREAANGKAIRFFRQLIAEYPAYPKLDDVRWYLAVEVSLYGSRSDLKSALLEAFTKSHTATITVVAQFAYAEVLRLTGEQELATSAYRTIVARYPAAKSVRCLARERLHPSPAFLALNIDDIDAFSEELACKRNQKGATPSKR